MRSLLIIRSLIGAWKICYDYQKTQEKDGSCTACPVLSGRVQSASGNAAQVAPVLRADADAVRAGQGI
jgi:hypothetical protein